MADLSNWLVKSFTKNEKDVCVICYKETPYKLSDHIDEREKYVEGAGQLCKTCYGSTYSEEPTHREY